MRGHATAVIVAFLLVLSPVSGVAVAESKTAGGSATTNGTGVATDERVADGLATDRRATGEAGPKDATAEETGSAAAAVGVAGGDRRSSDHVAEIPQGSSGGLLLVWVRAGEDPLEDVTVDVDVPAGLSVERVVTSEIGSWSLSGPSWTIDEVPAGRNVTATVVVAADENADPGRRTVGLTFREGSRTFASDTVPFRVVERSESGQADLDLAVSTGGVRESDSTGVADPRDRLPVRFSVSNEGTDAAANPTLVLTATGPEGWTVAEYEAAVGSWDEDDDRWRVAELGAGERTRPGVELAVPTDVSPGSYTVAAELRVSGQTVAEASDQVRIREDGSTNAAPSAAVSASNRAPDAGQPVEFDGSESLDPDGDELVSYEWDFDGDGTVDATGERVTHTFSGTGERTVTLTVSDGNATDTAELAVTVGEGDVGVRRGGPGSTPPTAEVSAVEGTTSVGERLTFDGSGSDDLDGRVVQYQWDFDGDGTVDASGTSPTAPHTYDEPGQYRVELTVFDGDGLTANTTQFVEISEAGSAPTATFEFAGTRGDDPSVIVAGEPVRFDASESTAVGSREILSYEWAFGDGTTSELSGRLSGAVDDRSYVATSHTYRRPGEYTVRLTVTDDRGTRATTQRTVTVIESEGPEITGVEPETEGLLPLNVGLSNTYRITVRGERDVSRVTFEFPDETVETDAEPVPLVGGTAASVQVPVDDATFDPGSNTGQKLARVTARVVDSAGAVDTRTFQVQLVDPPGWVRSLLGPDAEIERRGGGDVVPGRLGETVLPSLRYDLDGLGANGKLDALAGEYGIQPFVDPNFEYALSSGQATFGASTGISLADLVGAEVVTPVTNVQVTPTGEQQFAPDGPDDDSSDSGQDGSGGDITLQGRLDLTTSPPQFSGGRVGYAVDTEINAPTPVGTVVSVPTVGKVRVGVTLNLTVGAEPSVGFDLARGPPWVEPTDLSVESRFDLRIPAGAGVRTQVFGSDVGVEIKGFGGAGVTVPAQLLPEPDLTTPTADLVVGGDVCAGPCVRAVVYQNTFPVRVTPGSDGWYARRHATVDPAHASGPRTLTWVTPKRASVPAPAIGSDQREGSSAAGPASSDAGRVGAAPAVVSSPDHGTTARLTRNDVADRPPAVAFGEDGPTAVWSGQVPEKSRLNGFDVFAATRGSEPDSWSRVEPVTDDDVLDLRPDVATAGGERLVAWARARERFDDVNGSAGAFDIAVARATGDGWSDPSNLTSEALNLDPVVAGHETDDGVRWLVAWVRDEDRDLTTAAGRSVAYVTFGGSEGVRTGAIENGTAVSVASGPDGFTLAALRGDGADTAAVRTALAPNGTVRDRVLRPAPNATEVTAAPGTIAWVADRRGAGTRAFLARGGPAVAIPVDDTARDPRLTTAIGRPALVYTVATGPNRTRRPTYRVRGVDGWTPPRPLSVPGDLSATSLAAAAGADELLAIASAEDAGAKTDVFALSRQARPDLALNASVAARPGSSASLAYDVSNEGLRASGPTVLAVENESGVLRTTTVDSLAVGERANGSLSVPAEADDTLRVVVDPDDAVADSDRANNERVVPVAPPDLVVTGVSERRRGERVLVDVALRNRGDGPVRSAAVRAALGSTTNETTVEGLAAGRNWTVTLGFDAADLDGPVPASVAVVPETAGAGETGASDRDGAAVFRTTLLRPDVVVEGPVTVVDGPTGPRARMSVANAGTGAATAAVTVTTPSGDRTYQVTLPPAREPGDVAPVPVSLALPDVAAGENLSVSASPVGGVDADATDNVLATTVDSVEAADGRPNVTVSGLTATRENATANATVAVTLRNEGDVAAGETVRVSLAGTTLAERGVGLAPGENRTVALRVTTGDGGRLRATTGGDGATTTLAALSSDDEDEDDESDSDTGTETGDGEPVTDEGETGEGERGDGETGDGDSVGTPTPTPDSGPRTTSADSGTATSSGGGPGFGVLAAVAALVGIALALRRRG